MKYLQRYFCVFSCLVLLLVGYSVPANAEEITEFLITGNFRDYNSNNYSNTWAWNSGTVYEWETNNITANITSDYYWLFTHYVRKRDDTAIVKKGETFSMSFDNVSYQIYLQTSPGYYSNYPLKKFDKLQVYIDYTDGTYEMIDSSYCDVTYDTRYSKFLININEYTAKKDIQDIFFTLKYSPTNRMGWQGTYTFKIQMVHLKSAPVEVVIETKEAGLLKKANGLLESIKTGITDLFNSITELPSKIWGFIENGLKSLFVPSEENMTQYKNKWDSLLKDRFGAVYEVGDLVVGIGDVVNNYEEQNVIEMPKATINLPNNNTFSFGGYTVTIVPVGFEMISSMLKLVVGVVCTLLFINGMLKRYDELMGVEQ